MSRMRLSKAETRILEQYWKLGTCSVREILDSLPEDERVAYTTVQTLVYRLEDKGALRKVKKIGNAQLFVRQAARAAAAVEAKAMHEHIARALYYFQIHLLYASLVWCGAWVLTSIPRGSATTKYWIWVATSLNFIFPLGAVLDKVGAAHLSWASPLGVIGDVANSVSRSPATPVLGTLWLLGAALMLTRLCLRIRGERREAPVGKSALDPR